VDKFLGEFRVPVRGELGSDAQDVVQLVVIRIALVVANVGDLRERGCVLERRMPEHADSTLAGPILPGQDRHDRGLTGAVAAEETDDGVLRDAEADVVERLHPPETSGDVVDVDGVGHECSLSVESVKAAIMWVSSVLSMPRSSAS